MYIYIDICVHIDIYMLLIPVSSLFVVITCRKLRLQSRLHANAHEDNMYKIRRRPKDQSSDEEESDQEDLKRRRSPSKRSILRKRLQSQSSFNHINVDRKQTDKQQNNIFNVHSDGNGNDQKVVDFSMFKSKWTRCLGNDKEKGITSHCKALQRLGAALKVYTILSSKMHPDYNGYDDEMDPEIQKFSEFVGSEYRVQFLEDFNHFMAEHQHFAEEIKEEMIKDFGLKQCNATECKLTIRHFAGRRDENRSVKHPEDVRINFYRHKFDSLHFHIFHLEESGYRYRAKSMKNNAESVADDFDGKTENEKDGREAIDRKLESAVASINDNKNQHDFGRFQGDGPNKFTLSLSGNE